MEKFTYSELELQKLRKENKILRKIIFGGKSKNKDGKKYNKGGVLEHIDPYYKGCWDKLLAKIKK